MIRRTLVGLLACLPIAVVAQPVKLKMATFSPDTERLYNTVKKPWAAAVNKAAGGAIEIELYPNGALGRSPQHGHAWRKHPAHSRQRSRPLHDLPSSHSVFTSHRQCGTVR